MAITRIKSSNIEDGTVANVDIADLDSTKLTGTIATARLSNVDLTTLSASNLTTGTIPDARIPASAVTQHVPATDLTPVKNDISLLALQNAINGNLSAYGLKNSWIEQFENSTFIENLSSVVRNSSEYITSIDSDHGVAMVYQHNFSNSTTPTTNTVSATLALNGASFTSSGRNGYGIEWLTASSTTSQGLTLSISGDTTRSYCYWFYIPTGNNVAQYTADFRAHNETDWRGTTSAWKSGDYVNGTLLSGDYNISSLATDTWHHGIYIEPSTGITLNSRYAQESGHWLTNDLIIDSLEVYNGTISEANAALVAAHSGLLGGSASATGSFNSTDVVPQDAVNKSSVGLVVLYKDNAGTNTLNTDIVAKVRANTGQAYQTLVLASAGTYSDSLKIAIAPAISVTAGQALSYEISFANQSSGTKEARIYGVAMTY